HTTPRDIFSVLKFAVDGGAPQMPAGAVPQAAAVQTVPMPAPVAQTPPPALAASAPKPLPELRAAPAGPVVAVAHTPALADALTALLKAPQALDRHAAVRALANADCQRHPEVTAALLEAAYTDAVPAVRVDCVRCLAFQKAA